MTDLNIGLEKGKNSETKPLSPEGLDSAKGADLENNTLAQEPAAKPEDEQDLPKVQSPVQAQKDNKVAEETLPGVGYQLPAENVLIESDETIARLLILRDKMRNGGIPSNQQ